MLRSSIMGFMTEANLGGRRAEAARNDEHVLEAARQVFIDTGPAASMADIAARAGVGIGTLYRRYPNKADLMRVVCTEAMQSSLVEAQAALDEEHDGWSALTRFVLSSVRLGTGSLNGLAGAFEATDEMIELSRDQRALVGRIVDRAHREGALRADVTGADLIALIPVLSTRSSHGDDPELPRRYAQLMLDGMSSTTASALPGQSPAWADIEHSWTATLRSH